MAYPRIVLDYRHFVDEPSVIVFKKNGVVYALDCFSRKIIASGTDASTVMQCALDQSEPWSLVVVRPGEYVFSTPVTIDNRTVVAAGRPVITGKGFKVTGAGRLIGFVLRNIEGNAIEVMGGNIVIADNVIEYPTQDGIYIDGDKGAENLYVGNVIQSAERYAINLERSGTADLGGHSFRNNNIGNLSETIRTDAGARFHGPRRSGCYISWMLNSIDGIKDGPAMIIDGVTPVFIVGFNWITTAKNNIAIIDVKDCDGLTIKDAVLLGPSGCTGIIWRGENDSAFIDGIATRGISRLFALDTGAVLYNKTVGVVHHVDVPNASNIGAIPHIDGVAVSTFAGATPAGYMEIRVGTSSYKIPLYPLS